MDTIEEYKKCGQCPRKCGVDRSANQRGFCGETMDIRASLACLHFGEEPPVTVFGGSGAIFFTGCTLRCAFCQNYQISQQGFGRVLREEDFAKICLEMQERGAENINLITADHCVPLLVEFIQSAKRSGVTLPFCWNSSGYETIESLERLRGSVDIWLPDLKTLDPALAKTMFGAENYPEYAKNSILWMLDNFPLKTTVVKKGNEQREKILQGVIVRHLFLPARLEDTASVLEWLKKNADGRAYISLMSQYTPVPFKETPEKAARRAEALKRIENRLVSVDEDADLRDLIEAYSFEHLFYQELTTDTSWLPDFTRPSPFKSSLAKVVWNAATAI